VKRIAVASISARALAEAAAREGFGVIALDVFGDVDTRLASSLWLPIGAGGATVCSAAAWPAGCRAVGSRACPM
jgi:uncharacterized protein